MFKLQQYLLALLLSAASVNANDKCKPLQVAIEYAGFRAKVEELPFQKNKHCSLLRSTLESFESQMPEAQSYDQKEHLFTNTFDTVDLILDTQQFDHSKVKQKYQMLNQRMDQCKGPKDNGYVQSLLTINVSEKGKKRIEKEVHDVKLLWDREVRVNNQELVNIWFHMLQYYQTKHGKELMNKGKDLAYSEKTQNIRREVQEVLKDLKQEVQVNDRSLEIDNDKLKEIANKVDKIDKDYENLKRSKEFRDLKDYLRNERETNPDVVKMETKAEKFWKTKYGQTIKREVGEVETAINEEMKVADIPWDLKIPQYKGIGIIE